MAKFKQVTLKNGNKVWKSQVYLGIDSITGKQVQTTVTGKTKSEANLKANRAIVKFEENGRTVVKNSSYGNNYTFQEVFDEWKNNYRYTVKESGYWKTMEKFKLHILPSFGDKKIDEITSIDCQKAVHKWFEKVENTKQINHYAVRVFDYAIRTLKVLTENPALNLEHPKKNKIDEEFFENFFDPNELIKFEECMIEEEKRSNTIKWRTLFLLLAYTGMRKGEALALKWEDINFEKEEIRINKTVTRGEAHRLIIQPPKTEKSKRTVSIKDNHNLLSLLKDWNKELHLKNLVTGEKLSDLVFPNSKNSLQDPNYLNPTLDRIIERYKLKRITPHGFRHTHITILFLGGASIKQVQDRVGHGDVQTTMNIYNHIMQQSREEAPQLFEDILNKFKS